MNKPKKHIVKFFLLSKILNMKYQFSRDISTELEKKGLCADVASYIEDMVRMMDFDAFKHELMDAAYKLVIRKCNPEEELEENEFWDWINYREVCFPNELGCICCLGSYPKVDCKKNWCKFQECICHNGQDALCKCFRPYRRHYETSQNCRDVNQPDYEYFQNQL